MATNAMLQLTNGFISVEMFDPESICIAIDGSKSPALPLLDINRITEQWTFHIKDADANGLAKQVQRLKKLLNQVNEFGYTGMWSRQVYIRQQGDCEDNERIAFVREVREIDFPSILEHPGRKGLLVGVQMTIIREHPWRSRPPGTLGPAIVQYNNGGPADPSLVHVANFRDQTNVTHIYHYDDSAGVWSANLIAAASTTPLWPAAPLFPDFHLIGSSVGPFKHVAYGILVSAVINWNTKLEYWGGAAYLDMVLGVHYTLFRSSGGEILDDNQFFVVVGGGLFIINLFPPAMTGWTTHADGPGGIGAWWIRIKVVSVTGTTMIPQKNADAIYAPRRNHIEIPAAAIKGDTFPLANIRMWTPSGGGSSVGKSNLSRVLIGAKSDSEDGVVNLDDFEPMLNAGGAQNPAAWGVTYGIDTSMAFDKAGPGNQYALTTFATDGTFQTRVKFLGTAILPAYRGEYRLLVGVAQTGGNAGDISVGGRVFVGGIADEDPHSDTREAFTLGHDAGIEVLDLGLIQIPRSRAYSADTLASINLGIHLQSARYTGTGILAWLWIYLFPVLEGSVGVDDPVTDAIRGSSALRGGSYLDIDNGLIANRTLKFQLQGTDPVPADEWGRFNRPIEFRNIGKRTRLYFLMLHYSLGWGEEPLIASLGNHMAVELFMHQRYLFLRGSD